MQTGTQLERLLSYNIDDIIVLVLGELHKAKG